VKVFFSPVLVSMGEASADATASPGEFSDAELEEEMKNVSIPPVAAAFSIPPVAAASLALRENEENSDPNQLTVKRSLSFQKFPAGTRQKLVHCAERPLQGHSAVLCPPLKTLEDERPAETAMVAAMVDLMAVDLV
jgi:hypothetical protein